MLEIPVSYQGGKSRIAGKIIDIIFPSLDPICPIEDTIFFDFCCGSGAISIELINRGFDPSNIHMLDKGPWGIFWQDIGEGTFDLNKLYCLCQNVPKNKADIKTYMEHLSKQEANIDTPYVYLLLQASSFGGKAIWIEDNHWQNCSFRDYWQPTETSNRRSPVNPMMPMPETLFSRAKNICEKMKEMKAFHLDIREYIFDTNKKGIVYIDPPYEQTTRYGNNFDVVKYAKSCPFDCWVSEGKYLSDKSVLISSGRKKGGISGKRQILPNEEWLSFFPAK